MNKKETALIEKIVNNCKELPEEAKNKVLWLTEGMALVGGRNNGKDNRR